MMACACRSPSSRGCCDLQNDLTRIAPDGPDDFPQSPKRGVSSIFLLLKNVMPPSLFRQPDDRSHATARTPLPSPPTPAAAPPAFHLPPPPGVSLHCSHHAPPTPNPTDAIDCPVPMVPECTALLAPATSADGRYLPL